MIVPLNRRNFIKRSGAAIAVAALAPGLRADETPKKRDLKKAFMMNAFPEKKGLSWMDKFKLLKEAGFEGAEPPSHLDQKEILAARDATGLIIPSVVAGEYTRPLSDDSAAKRAEAVEGLKQALRDAKAYGATSVLCVSGRVTASISYAAAYKRTQEGIRACIPLAEELGVKIAVENVWNNFLLSPMEAARYVDEFKSPAVGWHFDVGNVICNGWAEQWIRILGKRIQKLHIKEFSRKKMADKGLHHGFEVEYLEGDNDWPAVMKALDDIGYTGFAMAEPAWEPKGVEAGERLKQISEKMTKIFSL